MAKNTKTEQQPIINSTDPAPTAAEDLSIDFYNITDGDHGLNDQEAIKHIAGEGKKVDADQQPADLVSIDMAGTIIKVPFSVAAAFLGDHWELSDKEITLMAPPAARLFSQLFGSVFDKYPDAYMLGFALCVCVAPRAAKTIKQKKEDKQSQNIGALGDEDGNLPDTPGGSAAHDQQG